MDIFHDLPAFKHRIISAQPAGPNVLIGFTLSMEPDFRAVVAMNTPIKPAAARELAMQLLAAADIADPKPAGAEPPSQPVIPPEPAGTEQSNGRAAKH